MKTAVSQKSILRISTYRRVLRGMASGGAASVFSHELAARTGYTAAQVRRDLMNIGVEGRSSQGYDISASLKRFDEFLDGGQQTRLVLFGVGRLGKAMLQFFLNNRPNLKIVAAFDVDPSLTGRVVCGVHCYPLEQAKEYIQNLDASMAIVAVPGSAAGDISHIISGTGIRGVFNLTPAALLLPGHVREVHLDITAQLEALACQIRQ